VRLFADGGFDVCGGRDGREAIEKAQGLNPGLIVMDLSMPVMNGIDAARCLRQLLPRVLIIILSDTGTVPRAGSPFPWYCRHCFESGVFVGATPRGQNFAL